MDSAANKAEQLSLAKDIIRTIDNGDTVDQIDIDRLAELVVALHEWERINA